MAIEPPFTIDESGHAHNDAQSLYDTIRPQLAAMLPEGADIRHVGATAVPGCLTKGDLDIVVRVEPRLFQAADAALSARYARNTGSTRSETFSAFADEQQRPHLGIQLVAIGSELDVFHSFAEALASSPQLLEQYNAMKRAHQGAEMAVYRAVKSQFVENVLAELRNSA